MYIIPERFKGEKVAIYTQYRKWTGTIENVVFFNTNQRIELKSLDGLLKDQLVYISSEMIEAFHILQ
jgi:hypothetical protein